MSVSRQFIGKSAELHVFVFETSEQSNRAETGAAMGRNGEIEKADENSSSSFESVNSKWPHI
jgi:hypothetical protein